MVAIKLIPHILSWVGIVLILLRGFPERKRVVAVAVGAGFALGVAGTFFLFRSFPGDFSFSLIRDVVGGSFLLLWGIAVASIYRSTVRNFPLSWGERFFASIFFAGVGAFMSGMIAGAISVCRLGTSGGMLMLLILVLVACVLVFESLAIERLLPPSFTVSNSALMAGVVALLLFSSSSILRLDLFSPLSMKVMKFTHDFVHQFFESMLIPDHLFIHIHLWRYIGLLFGKEVGFWGGLIIWFAPAILIALAISFERLPSVAHIRQGAQRRTVVATAIRARRFRLVVPGITILVLAGAGYQSRFPAVEYWDPKPIVISAGPSGEIVIPLKGEVDLKDGKLHKYLFSQGGKEARFFVLMTPTGQLTVDLDACAICKPDGYGQTEGTVLCYYCKTLIPLETVGKPGGCNPVPIHFTEKKDGVYIDGLTLINTWSTTVQTTARVKEGSK
ncbi:MAG: DUF2318 domain-containing protein [Desulfuromonadales bacterium]|nr:DUF2318 domain-containing protein [Desulfuromonadales bacterium]